MNREVDAATAQEILNLYEQGFLEIVLAPGYAAPALEMLASSKRLQNIRLLEIPEIVDAQPARYEPSRLPAACCIRSVTPAGSRCETARW